jgi:hypothetical protein
MQHRRSPRTYLRRVSKNSLTRISVFGVTGALGLVGALSVAGAAPAQATTYPPSISSCNYSNGATPANPAAVAGVTPGSAITISCDAGSFPAGSLLAVIEASGLAGVVSPSSAELNEVDLGSLHLAFVAADGSLNTTFTVPATFSAPDSQASCPPTQAQVNAGLSCDLIVANLAAVPQNVAMLAYEGQGTPNAPTLHTTFTVNSSGVKTLIESDVAGACPTPVTAESHCWWGAPVTGAPNATAFSGIPGLEAMVSKTLVTNNLTVSPAVYCQAGATAQACAGQPAGTLVPPQLSGTITTKLGLQHVLVDEPNTTPYPGNGTLAALTPGSDNVQAAQTGPPVSLDG